MRTSLSIRDKILYGLDLATLKGLEIGPLMSPLVTKDQGDIHYVDRATTAEIKQWYQKNETIDLDKIVDVDYVWGDNSLAQATGEKHTFDYCVASHVIEHVPDLIGWLQEISEILKDYGTASFSVPDRRYTFDYLRPETVPADLIEAYHRKLKKPSLRHIYDHFSNYAEIDIVEAWSDGFDGSSLTPLKDPRKVNEICSDAYHNDTYIDSHCWVFTVDSFLSLLSSLSEIGLLDFRIKRFFRVEHLNFEFVVQLEKLPENSSYEEKRRLFSESLKRIHNHEVRVTFSSFPSGKAQLYYDAGKGFNEMDCVTEGFTSPVSTTLEFSVPPVKLQGLRFDPVRKNAIFLIHSIEVLIHGDENVNIPLTTLKPGDHLKKTGFLKGSFFGVTYRNADDPHVIFHLPKIK